MAEIKILDTALINKIAAGEVVERPSSIIKELCENSIDAGAREITIEIRDGGISEILVTDDGCGIESAFVRTAFMQHATSKIASLEELENVATLGFRGEALSSIAAVSELEIITKTKEAETGTRLLISGGEVTDHGECAANTGTRIRVSRLFFNTPVRKKFLKKPGAESASVSDLVMKLVLSRPDIRFTYRNNGQDMLQSPGDGELSSAIKQCFGKEAAENLLNVSLKKDGMALTGFAVKPEVCRSNRSYGNFFINGRFVKSAIVSAAAELAYKTRLPIGKFPIYVLNLSCDPADVDVNVHPSKLEVRFGDDELISEFVTKAVEKAFAGKTLITKAALSAPDDEPKPAGLPPAAAAPVESVSVFENDGIAPELLYNRPAEPEPPEIPMFRAEVQAEPVSIPEADSETEPERFFKNYRVVGQVFDTYWIIEQDGSMYMIDQHAAHERVMYERYTNSIQNGETAKQRLIMPIALNVRESEALLIRSSEETLSRLGFELEDFGAASFALRSVPSALQTAPDAVLFMEVVDRLADYSEKGQKFEDCLQDVATMACKAAVKARDKLSYAEAKALIEQMLTLENPFTCPHGRPTVIEISKHEIERKFRRV